MLAMVPSVMVALPPNPPNATGVAWNPSISVSGQSSGASMAIQHLFAFSATTVAAAIAAGSPYGCGTLKHSRACYYGLTEAQLRKANTYARQRASQGLIDPLSNLWTTPVVLFDGTSDWMVYKREMKSTAEQVRAFVDTQWVTANVRPRGSTAPHSRLLLSGARSPTAASVRDECGARAERRPRRLRVRHVHLRQLRQLRQLQ
jgi:hypothetical protein